MSETKDLDILLEKFAAETVPGCGMIVMQKGKVLYEGYKGYADIAVKRKVDENTIFRLYSMTKVIVCTAALIQFERGAFLLDEPYSKYFPEYENTQVAVQNGNGSFSFRPVKRPIRIRDCFNMCCGLPYPGGTHPTDEAMIRIREELEKKGKYTLQDDVRAMGQVPVRFDPAEHWLYGFGHEMVAALVEVTSGMTIGEFLKKEIFEPLGMKSTGYRYEGDERERMAVLYNITEDGQYVPDGGVRDARHEPDAVYEGGGAGLFSTIHDYAVFTQMLANGGVHEGKRIIGRRTIDLMRRNMLSPEQMKDFTNTYLDGYGYGLGVRTMVDPAGCSNTPVGEFGWTGAAGTWTSIDPEDGFSAVYMHNTFPNNEEYHHIRVRAAAYGLIE